MSVTKTDGYKRAFQIAGVVVPLVMAAVGFFYGDIQPIVRDVCGTLLPKGSLVVTDAGAPR